MRATHRWLLGAGIAAIAATTWWVARSYDTPSLAPITARPAIEPAIPPTVAPAEITRTEERAPESASQPAEAARSENDVTALVGPADGLLVEGTVVVLDAGDRELAHETGSFKAVAWRDDGGKGLGSVAVRDGRFCLRLPVERELGVTRLELAGRPAHVATDRFAVTEGHAIEVKARFARPVVLHVVDAASRLELDDVTVAIVHDGAGADLPVPVTLDPSDLRAALVEVADSPISLSGPASGSNVQWRERVRVHAPGHVWGAAWADFLDGGETTVELVPGAELEITIVGAIPPAPPTQKISFDRDESAAVLRFRDASGWPFLFERAPAVPGPTRVEGLAPGRFGLTLERGKFWDRPQVLGETTVELVAGALAQATIVVNPPRERRRVPLAGTLHVSPSWECHWLDLRFEPVDVPGGTSLEERGLELDDLKPVPGSPGLYRFELAPVLPGRYLVKSYLFAFQQLVETGDAGHDDLALSIGDPADVVVHVLDDLNDRTMHAEKLLLWNCRWPDETTGGGLNATRWDSRQEAYCFRAPAGEIELRVGYGTNTYEPIDPRYFTVSPGPNELTIRVRRATGVLVWPEIDGVRTLWPRASVAQFRIEPVDGRSVTVPEPVERRDGLLLCVPSGGRWRILVPDVDGCTPVEPIEVTLAAGAVSTLGIPLRRKR